MAQEIGIAKVVQGHITATGAEGSRGLHQGSPVFKGDTVVTAKGSAGSIQFQDNTVLNVGEGSKVNLDQYVFDAGKGTGHALFKMAQGTFRAVTGEIVKHSPESFKIQSPLATIGIRGTETAHSIPPQGQGQENHLVMVFDGKPVVVQPLGGGAFQVISQSGMKVEVTASGVGPVLLMTPQEYKYFQALTEAGLQQGVPTDTITTGQDAVQSQSNDAQAAATAAQANAKAAAEAAAKAAAEAANSGDPAAKAAAEAAAELAAKAALEAKAAAEAAVKAAAEAAAALQAQALAQAAADMAAQQAQQGLKGTHLILSEGQVFTLSDLAHSSGQDQGAGNISQSTALLYSQGVAESFLSAVSTTTTVNDTLVTTPLPSVLPTLDYSASASPQSIIVPIGISTLMLSNFGDTVSVPVAAMSVSITGGAGDDTMIYSAPSGGTPTMVTGSIDGGDGENNSIVLAGNIDFTSSPSITNIQTVSLGAGTTAAFNANQIDGDARMPGHALVEHIYGNAESGTTETINVHPYIAPGYGYWHYDFSGIQFLDWNLGEDILNITGSNQDDWFIMGENMNSSVHIDAKGGTVEFMPNSDDPTPLENVVNAGAVVLDDPTTNVSLTLPTDLASCSTLGFDASALTHGLTLDASALAAGIDFTAGSGSDAITGTEQDDTFRFGQNLNGDTITGGGGTDTLHYTDNSEIGNQLANVSNVANIIFDNTDSNVFEQVDAALFPSAGLHVDATALDASHTLTFDASGVADQYLYLNLDITGGDGADTILGGGGHDTIIGGAGDDSLTGGEGIDAFYGGLGNDTFVFNPGDVTDVETVNDTGGDTIIKTTGSMDLSSVDFSGITTGELSGNLTLELSPWANVTMPGSVLSLASSLVDAGNQALLVGSDQSAETLTLNGTEDADTLDASFLTPSTGWGDEGDSIVLNGLAGNDTLIGGSGNDSLYGGDGDDSLNPGLGNDSIDGGDGTDTLDYSFLAVDEPLQLVGDEDGTGTVSYVDSQDTSYSADFSGIEVIKAGAGDDSIQLNGWDSGAEIYGLGGGDTIEGGAGADHISGGDGNDYILGGTGDDTLDGGDGDDTVEGGVGSDVLTGGDGFDTVSFAHAASAITASLADGASSGGDGTDTFSGFEGILGSGYSDTLTGDAAANAIDGGLGNDSIQGGLGNDSIQGGVGNDTLDGGAGNDVLTGGAGDDILFGGAGADNLTGGDSADYFAFRTVSEAADTITDFTSGVDKLAFFATSAGGDFGYENTEDAQEHFFATLDDFNASAGEAASWYLDTGSHTLMYDSDGTLDGDLGTAIATGINALSATDLIVIDANSQIVSDGESGGGTTFTGTAGADTFIGTDGDDTFNMGAYLTSADHLDGGAGIDTLTFAPAVGTPDAMDNVTNIETVVLENPTAAISLILPENILGDGDTLTVDASLLTQDLSLDASALNGALDFTAGTGRDNITGSAQDDIFRFGANLTGTDNVDGGDGSDVLQLTDINQNPTNLNGISGIETIELFGSALNIGVTSSTAESLFSGIDNLTIDGSALSTGLSFNASHVSSDYSFNIIGGAGNDTLSGGAGSDTLTGGSGADRLSGGRGDDIFIYQHVADGGDTITDFNAGDDTIAFLSAQAGGDFDWFDTDAAQARFFDSQEDVVGTTAALYVAGTSLYYDSNGVDAGGATLIAQNVDNVNAGNISVIGAQQLDNGVF